MFKKLNDKGSLPLVMLIVMIIAMSIATLASMLMTEKINMAYSITTDMDNLYEKDSVIEVTKNVIRQVLQEKMWADVQGEQIVDSNDLSKIEEAVSVEVLPTLGIEYAVRLEGTYPSIELTRYCQETADSEAFAKFDCSNEVFGIELKLWLEKEGASKSYLLVLDNVRVISDETGNGVRLDMSETAMHLK